MNVLLWVLQVVLALAFLIAGSSKLLQPKEKLVKTMGWTEDFAEPTLKAIGTLEILGAIGLLLPAVTGVATWLTPVAAVGLAVVMSGAVAVHLRRKEAPMSLINVALGAIAVVIAWGRFGPYDL